jgi:hypothetical protein
MVDMTVFALLFNLKWCFLDAGLISLCKGRKNDLSSGYFFIRYGFDCSAYSQGSIDALVS